MKKWLLVLVAAVMVGGCTERTVSVKDMEGKISKTSGLQSVSLVYRIAGNDWYAELNGEIGDAKVTIGRSGKSADEAMEQEPCVSICTTSSLLVSEAKP